MNSVYLVSQKTGLANKYLLLEAKDFYFYRNKFKRIFCP